ncbi:MAG TPA: hypothetical protein VHB70_20135 [Parafilimonas sp.]|nr:hypothetical protein [Parafilimonas sp.]
MNKKYTGFVLLNTLTFLLVLFINFASSTKLLANKTVADVSHKYDTLFAPANYAFVIWLVIYLLCIGFVIFQWVLLKNDPNHYIQRTGIWFTVSNIANALWCYCWVHEWLGWCVIIILVQLLSLAILVVRLRLELDDEPVRAIFFVWWPICFYIGWLITATVACIASWLVYINWNGFGISADVWTMIMIIIACLIYAWFTQKRNMREAASVGIWAFIAIAIRQWNVHSNIVLTAIITSAILLILISIHGYKGRYYAPFVKLKRGEW